MNAAIPNITGWKGAYLTQATSFMRRTFASTARYWALNVKNVAAMANTTQADLRPGESQLICRANHASRTG